MIKKQVLIDIVSRLLRLMRSNFSLKIPRIGRLIFDHRRGKTAYDAAIIRNLKSQKECIHFISADNFLSQIGKDAYIGPGVHCLSCWLPYVESRTAIYVNNFFGTNYAIRSPVLVQITLFNKAEPSSSTHTVWLHNGQSYLYDELFEPVSCEDSFLYIQLFNPMIDKDHGGSGGYIRVHGLIYKNADRKSASVVHSMPVIESRLRLIKEGGIRISPRGFMPPNGEGVYDLIAIDPFKFSGKSKEINLKSGGKVLLKETPELTIPCIINRELGEVSAIWHDGPDLSHSIYSIDHKKIEASQGIWVPNFSVNAPFLFFSKENHASTSRAAYISLYQNGRYFESDQIELSAMPFFVDTKSLFPDATAEKGCLFIVFPDSPIDCVGSLMVNVVFRDGGGSIGDGVHTASGFDLLSRPPGKTLAMRIWGPYVKMEGCTFVYTLVNSMNFSKPSDVLNAVKMRVITDRQHEFVLNIDLIAGNDIFSITSAEIDKLFNLDLNSHRTASIQFESSRANLQGNFYILGENGELGVDHLTGG